MTTSYNGWSASPTLKLRPLVVDGVAFVPGIRDDDDVATVLGYVAEQFHARVEPLRNPGCWGFAYRANRNAANLSNHASGTAIDCNAPEHPNGVSTAATFTPGQVAEIHKILDEVDHVVRWGGDYTGTPDSMHFEINANAAAVHAVAQRLGDDMFSDDDRKLLKQINTKLDQAKARDQRLAKKITGLRDKVKGGRVESREILAGLDELAAALED